MLSTSPQRASGAAPSLGVASSGIIPIYQHLSCTGDRSWGLSCDVVTLTCHTHHPLLICQSNSRYHPMSPHHCYQSSSDQNQNVEVICTEPSTIYFYGRWKLETPIFHKKPRARSHTALQIPRVLWCEWGLSRNSSNPLSWGFYYTRY